MAVYPESCGANEDMNITKSSGSCGFQIKSGSNADAYMDFFEGSTFKQNMFWDGSADKFLLCGQSTKVQIAGSSSVRLGIGTNPGTAIIEVAGGASCDGTDWLSASSRSLKTDIKELTAKKAKEIFKKLKPVSFKYKENKNQTKFGFIAEDVPKEVAEKERKSLSPMNLVGLLTKVVQDQMIKMEQMQDEINLLKA